MLYIIYYIQGYQVILTISIQLYSQILVSAYRHSNMEYLKCLNKKTRKKRTKSVLSRTWVSSGSYHRPRWTRRARRPCNTTSPLGSRWTLQVQENMIITFGIQNIKTRISYMFNNDALMMLWRSYFKLCLK